jgi:ribonuclease HI
MQILGHLAARDEPMSGGFSIWGAVLRADEKIVWTDTQCIGLAPKFTFAEAQHTGAVELLRRIVKLAKQNETRVRFLTDSSTLVDELRGEYMGQRSPTETSVRLLAEARSMVLWLEPVMTMRYCRREDVADAHELISLLCRQHRVPMRERMARR